MEPAIQFKSRPVWILCFHIVIGNFLFLYTLGVFNTCADNISTSLGWGSSKSLYITIFSSLVPIGGLVGTLVTSYLITRFGRRKTIIITDILYICATAVLVSQSTIAFGVGRFLTGACAGIFLTIGPLYVNEVAPESLISKVGPLVVISSSLGLVFAYFFGLVLPTHNLESDPLNYWWVFMFVFPGIVAFYQLLCFILYFKLDSPQFYLEIGDTEKSKQALAIIYTPEGLGSGFERINAQIQAKKSSNEKFRYTDIFTKKRFSKMMRIGSILCSLNQFSGVNAIVFYSTDTFQELGGGIFKSRLLTCAIGVINLFSSLISLVLLKYFGRKTLIISGQVFLSIDLFLLGLFSGYVDAGLEVPAIFIMAYFLFVPYSLGVTMWTYVGEILNDHVLTFCCILNMATNVIIAAVYPFSVASIGVSNTFFCFCGFMIIGAIYCYFDLIETKGKIKKEILVEMKCLDISLFPSNNQVSEDDGKILIKTNKIEHSQEKTEQQSHKIIPSNELITETKF